MNSPYARFDPTIQVARNGFIAEGAMIGDASPPAHVFNDPDALGRWVAEWAKGELDARTPVKAVACMPARTPVEAKDRRF